MDTFASAILLLIGLVAFGNYKNGTLPDWLKSKFLNASDPPPASPFEVSSSSTTNSGPNLTLTGLGGALGGLLTPVVGAITGVFGEDRGSHNHKGIDYAVGIGTPVKVARGGVIKYAGNMSGYGLTVDVDHGAGYSTRYGHLSQIRVNIGQSVAAGETIALSGNTGRSTGPHLHFELHKNGSAIDPTPHLGGVASVGAALTA